jgi:hypothetical protein
MGLEAGYEQIRQYQQANSDQSPSGYVMIEFGGTFIGVYRLRDRPSRERLDALVSKGWLVHLDALVSKGWLVRHKTSQHDRVQK